MVFSFRLSIDDHSLNVISTDGSAVRTCTVESVIISTGERYDFWLNATNPGGKGSFWIRLESLEEFRNGKVSDDVSNQDMVF